MMQLLKKRFCLDDGQFIDMGFKRNDTKEATHVYGAWMSPTKPAFTLFAAIMLADETIELIVGDDIIINGSSTCTFLHGSFDHHKMTSRLFCVDSDKKIVKIPTSKFWMENQDGMKVSKNSNNGYANLLHLVGIKFPLEAALDGSAIHFPETIAPINESSSLPPVDIDSGLQAAQVTVGSEAESVTVTNPADTTAAVKSSAATTVQIKPVIP